MRTAAIIIAAVGEVVKEREREKETLLKLKSAADEVDDKLEVGFESWHIWPTRSGRVAAAKGISWAEDEYYSMPVELRKLLDPYTCKPQTHQSHRGKDRHRRGPPEPATEPIHPALQAIIYPNQRKHAWKARSTAHTQRHA